MANSTGIFIWAAASTTAVCALQTTVGAATLVINGGLVQGNSYPPPPIASFGNVSRTVSLTSTNNLSGVNVTIVGTFQGAVQTSTIAGPNNNTVFTTLLYDTVTSVTVSGAVTAMSVGSGTTGNIWWYPYDYYRHYPSMSVQVVVTGTINYSFQTTLDDVTIVAAPTVNVGLVVPQPNNVNAYTTVMSSATATAFASFSYPVRFCNVIVNSATTGSITVKLLQQGIK